MNDPFDTRKVNRQLMREAKIGLAMVVVLGGFFAYVGYFRMGNIRSQLPAHIIDAPLATNVGQDYYKQFQPPKTSEALSTAEELAANAVLTENPPKSKSPFQLPSAVRNIRERMKGSFTGAESSSDQEPATGNKQTPRVASNQATPDLKSGNGPIPVGKLRSESPNRQNEFDIARSGPGGAPQPFNASVTNPDKIEAGVKPPVISGDFVKPPKARTAREISVTEKDQSSVQRPSSHFSSDGVMPSSWNAPLDLSPAEPVIATTETLRSLPAQPALPSKPIPAAFTKPRSKMFTEASPQPDNSLQWEGPQPAAMAVKERTFEEHRVKKGESFWSLAQTYLNDGRLFRALYEHNRHRVSDFENLKSGTQLEIPTAKYLVQRYSELVPSDLKVAATVLPKPAMHPGNTEPYVTQTGETLFDIAKEKYGQASRYLDILNANQEQLPANVQHMSRLPAGLELNLPR